MRRLSETLGQTLAVIPARGGSRGIPQKNIAPVFGRPLLAWTIEAALKADEIDRVVVSSDCDEVLKVARRWGAEPLHRPKELATDICASEPVLGHAFSTLQSEGANVETLVLLQPTSPLRDAGHIDEALALLGAGVNAVISVYEPRHSPHKCLQLSPSGSLQGLVDEDAPFRRRQDLPMALMPNGAIYAITAEAFRQTRRLLTDRTAPYIMAAHLSLDIDTPKDLQEAERRLRTLRPASVGLSTRRRSTLFNSL
ncbi:MAG: acylneuraminate cytidylyltransferase family protein [Myxococcota bacterium]